jgi:UDP-3-O-[3-hydroxymyristoyl] N-acetylglucosamine deacetylase / 3-hydroxyacyl-[acyl-carrier-protein] dehydratase
VKQRTIHSDVSLSGVGLHTGENSTLTLKPAAVNEGIHFIRTDLDGSPRIRVCPQNAVEEKRELRRTVIRNNGAEVHTVEHVLAAISGLCIDNIDIELDGLEVPDPNDGSAMPFVEMLEKAGIKDYDEEQDPFIVTQPVAYSNGDVQVVGTPYDGLKLSFTIQFDNPVLGTQHISLDITPDVFKSEIASSRTFVLFKDVEYLRELGLIKGGNLDNAVVIKDDGIMNEAPLRFPDECVRHKVLDLLGDLSLLGRPVKGHFHAVRSGHPHNLKFVKMLHDRHSGPGEYESMLKEVHFDINDIERIMPHRYPLLLVDRILYLKERERVVGIKNVTVNEPFFVGHFPGHPIMPAVLIVEAMAQVGGVLLLNTVENPESKLVYFMGINSAKFRKPVLPGDQLVFDLKLLRLKRRTCKMVGKAYVQGKLVAEAELLSSIVDREVSKP